MHTVTSTWVFVYSRRVISLAVSTCTRALFSHKTTCISSRQPHFQGNERDLGGGDEKRCLGSPPTLFDI